MVSHSVLYRNNLRGSRRPGARRSRMGFAMVIFLLARLSGSTAEAAAEPSTGEASASKSPSTLRLLTLNLAHGRGTSAEPMGCPRQTVEKHLDEVARVIRREQPQVVALQEVDGPSTLTGGFDHLERLKSAAEFKHSFRGYHFDRGALGVRFCYGTAILADRELFDTHTRPFADNDLNAKGFVAARIALDGRSLLVVSVHLNSQSQDLRRKQASELVEFVRSAQLPTIVCGDLNAQWRYPHDAVRLLARELNLDAFEPESTALNTFPSVNPARRIDWILISPDLKFLDSRVVNDPLSDHRAVMAEVRWKNAE